MPAYTYEVHPRSHAPGWRLFLLADADEVGGGLFPPGPYGHGLAEGADVHALMSELPAYGQENGFLVVSPHGTGTPVRWAVGTLAPGSAAQNAGLQVGDRILAVGGVAVSTLADVRQTMLMSGLTPFPRDAWWRESRLLPHVVVLAERARTWLPERIATQIRLDGSEAPALLPSLELTPT